MTSKAFIHNEVYQGYLKLQGVYAYDFSKYTHPFAAYIKHQLIGIGKSSGLPHNCSQLTDWMDIANDTFKATGKRVYQVLYIDNGFYFTPSQITVVSDLDSISYDAINRALNDRICETAYIQMTTMPDEIAN